MKKTLYISVKYKISVFFLIFSLVNSCNLNEQKDKKRFEKIEKELKINFKNGYVVVLSEYDCISCLKALQNKINFLIETSKNFVIAYFTKNNNTQGYPKNFLQNYPNFQSFPISKDLFSQISISSIRGSSPFLIEISDSKITEIISITKK